LLRCAPGSAAAAIAEKAPVSATEAATATRVTKEADLSPRLRARRSRDRSRSPRARPGSDGCGN